ncbi:hypothetical protein E8E13_000352 [Curvularia kusanoi]|uniref:Cytochrome P450 n=1 Tax=Curvularia kusanoi TaxID=90978 RepID=A0A9P4T3C9_CURKU|nr:hypothetical protein E8E13_000352 [Curvularia kusanoi]
MCKNMHAPLQHAESVQMLYDMMQNPISADWKRHIERFTNSTVLSIGKFLFIRDEIDREVPSDRIPDQSDFSRLPYVMSIIKEVQRWRPLGGIAIPHSLSEDVWVDGKLLPKNATILTNIWALSYDEKRYPNPELFDPDRFQGWTGYAAEYANSADPDKRDHYAYGNGRRVCPGIHLAERNLLHVAAKMLWAFKMELTTDPATGEPIVPDINPETGYSEGLVLCVDDFPVEMKVRSAIRRKVIEESYDAACIDVFAKYDEMNDTSTQ